MYSHLLKRGNAFFTEHIGHPSARIIREARQAAGLTQLELAEKLGVTIGTIGYYERGAGMPKTDNLFALCDILHIRPADLLRADS